MGKTGNAGCRQLFLTNISDCVSIDGERKRMDCTAKRIAIPLELEVLDCGGMEDYIVPTHFVPLVFKFCGKEFPFSDPWQKDMVTFPKIEIKHVFVEDPFQPAFG